MVKYIVINYIHFFVLLITRRIKGGKCNFRQAHKSLIVFFPHKYEESFFYLSTVVTKTVHVNFFFRKPLK